MAGDTATGSERIRPAASFSGTVRVPGDKSISHRALMMSGLASGESVIRGLSAGRDVMSTLSCMRALGVRAASEGPDALRVTGCAETGLAAPGSPLDAGNSGTTMRILSGILAGQPFSSTITGDRYLRRRPMGRIIKPLEMMGATVRSPGDSLPPLTIEGGGLRGIEYHLPVASAQVKSCVLLAGLFAGGVTTVVETVPSRDHTERMLALFGVTVRRDGLSCSVEGGSRPAAADLLVPGDPSSAAFFAAAAAMIPGGEVRLDNLCLNPTRAAFFGILETMGARVRRLDERTEAGEPVADLIVSHGELTAVELGGDILPSLIDEVPILAVVASRARGTTVIRDAAELRVKETDRLRAVSENLRSMGATVREHPDGLEIDGPCELRGARLESFGDHRIAMAFAVAALAARGETEIADAACADISFPGFYQTLRELTGE